MFHTIPQPVLERMRYLEQRDAQDRIDGTPFQHRLRQIPPETGKFLALMAANAPEGIYLEIGTSAGYSALWISLACKHLGRTLYTIEILPEKVRLARETFRMAQVESIVTLIEGDAREHLPRFEDIAFCFLDAEKEIYADCYEAVIPRLVRGGLLLADNVLSHKEVLTPLVEQVLSDQQVDALVVPIGKGVLLCRKV